MTLHDEIYAPDMQLHLFPDYMSSIPVPVDDGPSALI